MRELSWRRRQAQRLGSSAALAVLLVAGLGCWRGDDINIGPTAPRNADIAGTWDLTVTSNRDGTFTAVATFSQSGSTVQGTFSTEGGAGGNMSGTITGHQFTFTLEQTTACQGSFSGSATLSTDERRLDGDYSGGDCQNSGLSSTFTATKR